MASTAASLTFTGTELAREGTTPLIALAAYADDGRMVSASIVDPVVQGDEPVVMPRHFDRMRNTIRVA